MKKPSPLARPSNCSVHPVYSAVMYNLALLHMEQEDWEEAGTLLRKVCVARTASLGSQDQATMEAWLSLAKVSIQQHNWPWANMAYQRALPVCEQLLGAEHPVTLDHHKQAANVLLHLEESPETEAKQPLPQVLQSREPLRGYD